ncbi:cinnamate 4-hydroxylase, putative [Medicago truncatula]|uniref:Cinnamate 4-hydroxylase, putative n=1 Tax=Medicago truncatula TaxID=3880 RepID=Q2HS01_MEDTR|nr:hypothetical protein MtrDRAFT_AC157504g3v2 [Medicago truncatula]AES65248.1 cinnamate 4-hydroxylase, putative [Medicago truncatula]
MDLLLLRKTLLALFIAATIAIIISIICGKSFKLPPGPFPVPIYIYIFGNLLQVGDDLNHRNLTNYAKCMVTVLVRASTLETPIF